ncbi:MAG: hypothetical protein IT266_06450 [Saprospiraceae bacterium]|nr:hypothetical protein [Saprospiraceae bacterium]
MVPGQIAFSRKLTGHTGAVYCLSPGLEPGTLLSAGGDGRICCWTPEQSGDAMVVAETGERIFAMRVFPQYRLIAAATMSGDLLFLRPGEPIPVRKIRVHRKAAFCLLEMDGNLVAAGSDGLLSAWDPVTGEALALLQCTHHRLRAAAYCEKQGVLLLGDHTGALMRMKWPEGNAERIEGRHARTIFCVWCDPVSGRIVSGGLDAQLVVSQDFDSGVVRIPAHRFCVHAICDLRGTPWVATASRDRTVRLWDRRDFRLAEEISKPNFAAHDHSVNALWWDEDRRRLFTAGDDRQVLVWNLIGNHDPER